MNSAASRDVAPRRRSRTILIATGFCAAMAVTSITAAGVYRAKKPELARILAPYDALASASIAFDLAQKNRQQSAARARLLANSALQRDPTAVRASLALGLTAAFAGDVAEAESRFNYADTLSRRELATQLWFIEKSVAADDTPGALARYDLALRGSPSFASTLFPILTAATGDAEISSGLNRILRTNPVWRHDFLAYFIASSTDPKALARVSSGVFSSNSRDDRRLLDQLLNKMIALGAYDLAYQAYRQALHSPSRTDAIIRDPLFASSDPVGPFEWMLSANSDLMPEVRPAPGGNGNMLILPSNPRADGEIARQLLRLEAGPWQLQLRVGGVAGPDQDRPRLVMTCAATPQSPLLTAIFPATSAETQRWNANVSLPTQCRFVWLSIAVRQPSESSSGNAPYIMMIDAKRI